MFLVNCFMITSIITSNNFLNVIDKTSSLDYKLNLIAQVEKSNSIGIVDFRKILRNSNAMKKLGAIFIDAEKKINQELKNKQIKLKKLEKKIILNKNIFSSSEYKKKIRSLKQQVFNVQNDDKVQRSSLNKSFQNIQKKLKDMLAKIIKDISLNKNMSIVILRENVFIFNDKNIDFTLDALNSFNMKTKDISIKLVLPK